MTAEAALLAPILANPTDDTPRLVFADWLEEGGQPERAEFIRVQCEIARLERAVGACDFIKTDRPPSDTCYDRRADLDEVRSAGCKSCRSRMPLHERQLWLLNEWDYRRGWRNLAGREAVSAIPPGALWCDHIQFRRGFVEEIRLTCEAFVGGAECIRCRVASSLANPLAGSSIRYDSAEIRCGLCPASPLAGQLFAANPITRVVLSDKFPRPLSAGFTWRRARGGSLNPEDLPGELYDLLSGRGGSEFTTGHRRATVYLTGGEAHDALFDAAVELGQKRASEMVTRLRPSPAQLEPAS